jgi:hypothetical protein
MISSSYSIPEFIKAVEDKGYQDLICLAEREATEAERMSYRPSVAMEAKRMGNEEYAEDLKHFLFYLRYHIKPFGVSDTVFELFKMITRNLENKRRARVESYGFS